MLTLLARISVLQGQVAEARELLAQAKAVVPLNPGRSSDLRREVPAAGLLTRVLLRQEDREAEAAQYLEQCRQLALDDQIDVQIKWRSLRALLLAREGRLEEAERLAEQATSLAERSEQPGARAEALADRAEVLLLAGKPGEAVRAARAAADLYEGKGCTVLAAEARNLPQRFKPHS